MLCDKHARLVIQMNESSKALLWYVNGPPAKSDVYLTIGLAPSSIIQRNNLVKDSRKDGFLVGRKGRDNALKGNVAKRSGDDGFDIESRSTKLTSNLAVRNNDLGIEAVPGVIDGGGNEASGNGDLRQCINIVCR